MFFSSLLLAVACQVTHLDSYPPVDHNHSSWSSTRDGSTVVIRPTATTVQTAHHEPDTVATPYEIYEIVGHPNIASFAEAMLGFQSRP